MAMDPRWILRDFLNTVNSEGMQNSWFVERHLLAMFSTIIPCLKSTNLVAILIFVFGRLGSVPMSGREDSIGTVYNSGGA